MADSQTKPKPETTVDARTPWQKAEYERRRISYRKDFKELCLKHIQFLKRKEALIDFSRLLHVWQVYIKYKKLEAATLLQGIATQANTIPGDQQQNLTTINSLLSKQDINNQELLTAVNLLMNHIALQDKNLVSSRALLEQQIMDINGDLADVHNKNTVINESLLKFMEECPVQAELLTKDFINVVREESPQVQIDGALVSALMDNIRMNFINAAHTTEMQMQVADGALQILELEEQKIILETKQRYVLQQQEEHKKFSEYLLEKKTILPAINIREELLALQTDVRNYQDTVQEHYTVQQEATAIATTKETLEFNDFQKTNWQIALLEEQKKADIIHFDYRAFVQQENIFKKTCKRNQALDLDTNAELERKLMDIREYKEERQQRISADFKNRRLILEQTLAQGKTDETMAALKAKHFTAKPGKAPGVARMYSEQDSLLPVPQTPSPSKFGLEKERDEVIVAIAQTVCESLARLAITAGGRSKPKSPQELAGLLYVEDQQLMDNLQKSKDDEDKATMNLQKSRREICQLGEKINQLIKGLE